MSVRRQRVRDEIDVELRRFQGFLNAAFPAVEPSLDLGRGDAALNDWYQANWELLVESRVCEPGEFLEPYGAGADLDYRPASSRVSYPEFRPTHRIRVWPRDGERVVNLLNSTRIQPQLFEFDRFVAFDGSRYDDCSPFSHVLLALEGTIAVIDASGIAFRAEPAV